jgi:hypothetical protein
MADIINPSQKARLRYKFPDIGIISHQGYDAVIVLIDKTKDLYRVRDLHTNREEDFNLANLNQTFIILQEYGRYGN